MRIAVTAAVLLAVVATAVVTVCQHSETRHLQYRVWRLERRRERLQRDRERVRAAIESARTPRRLLVEHDLGLSPTAPRPRGFSPEAAYPPILSRAGQAYPPHDPSLFPAGFDPGDNFEGGER